MRPRNRRLWWRTARQLAMALILCSGLIELWHAPTPVYAAPADAGYALEFDGVNDFVAGPTPWATRSGSDSYTISAWIRPSFATKVGDAWEIVALGDTGVSTTDYLGFRIPADSSWGSYRKLQLMYDDGTYAEVVGTSQIEAGEWTHVAAVVDSGTVKLYINGVEDGTGTGFGPNLDELDKLTIGGTWYYGGGTEHKTNYFNGTIDEVRMWSVARTEAEIQGDMFRELVGSESGLVAYYKMSDGSGTALTDDSTNSYDGTLTNGPVWVTSDAFAGPQNALDFDGTDDYVRVDTAETTLELTGDLTLETWVQFDAFDTAQTLIAHSLGQDESSAANALYHLYVDTDRKLNMVWESGSGADQATISPVAAELEVGQWHHLAVSRSGTTVTFYVDGVELGTDAAAGPTGGSSGLLALGAEHTAGGPATPLAGKMDEVRIWNTPRTAAKIRANRYQSLTGDEAGLVAMYRFDQTGGTSLPDGTTNRLHGTLYNGTTAGNGPTWVPSGAFAHPQNALTFDGVDDYVQVATSSELQITGDLTLETWVKFDGFDGAQTLIAHGDSDAVDAGGNTLYGFTMDADQTLRLSWDHDAGTTVTATSPISAGLSADTWHHLAAMRDATAKSVAFYVDGAPLGTTVSYATNPTGGSAGALSLGGTYAATGPQDLLDGQMDEVRIWRAVRTAEEIRGNLYWELAGPQETLVAAYRMAEYEGLTLTDHSLHDHHGTLYNGAAPGTGPMWVTSGAFSGPRRALDFDGGDDYVSISSMAPYSTDITIEAWVKPGDLDSSFNNEIVSWWGGNPDIVEFRICGSESAGTGALHHLQLGIDGGSGSWGNNNVLGDTAIPEGVWTHVAAVKDNGSVTLYVNGIEDGSGPAAAMPSLSAMAIGDSQRSGLPSGDYNFSGRIDELRIWNVARSEQQLRETMNTALLGDEEGLVAYYRFDQTAGAALVDWTGNGHDGTLANMDAADWVPTDAFNTWIGSDSADWVAAGNWSRGVAPNNTDNAGDNAGVYSPRNSYDPDLTTGATVQDIVVAGGAVLDIGTTGDLTVSRRDFIYGTVTRVSNAGSSETRTFDGMTDLSYPVAGVAVTVTASSGASTLTILRTDATHPDASAGSTLPYSYTLTATGSGFTVDLCFSYDDADLGGLTESALQLCRWDGDAWTCLERSAASSTTENLVCASDVSSFSDWVIGAGDPTAIHLRDFAGATGARRDISVISIALVAAAAAGLVSQRRRTRQRATSV